MQYILDDKHSVDLDSLKIVRTLSNKVGITGKTVSGEHFNAYKEDGDGYHFTGFGDNIFSKELVAYTVAGVPQIHTAQADTALQYWFSQQKDVPDFSDMEPVVTEIEYDTSDLHYGRLFVECVINDFTQLKYEIDRETNDILGTYEPLTLEAISYLSAHDADLEEVVREQAIYNCIEACIRKFIKENPIKH